MRTCTACVLPETFPGISFDEKGVCSFCRQEAGRRPDRAQERERCAEKFELLLEASKTPEARKGRSYDALMAYSGGKDSTYTLLLLRKKHGLRVLALSFDNGFVSPAAAENIRRVTESLGVDHLFFRPRWELLRRLFAAAAEGELYARKTLERASTICTSCIGLVKAVCLKTAIEMGIPMVGYGWSPGQAPVQSAIMRTNPQLCRQTQQAILGPMREAVGPEVESWFLQERHFTDAARFPVNIHPLAWEHYDEAGILREIRHLGWRAPEDTDRNSTNCLLNAFANDVHVRRYGFHPYAWEIANMVRSGVMSRAEGLEKFHESDLADSIRVAKERLAL